MNKSQPRGNIGKGNSSKGGMQPGGGAARTKVIDRDGNDPADPDEGAGAAGPEDDEAIAAFFQEVKQEVRSAHVIRKVSGHQGLDVIKLGPEFVDDDYFECTPVPLWQKAQPVLNYDTFLDRTDDEIITITPIKPQTFSALFAFYRDRSPALNWDPHLTDLEEDCFYQDLIHLPSKKLTHSLPKESKKEKVPKKRVRVFKPSGDYVIKTRLTIELTETATLMLYELKGVTVPESDPKAAEIKIRNERYAEMVKDHIVSDTYANDYAQSFEDYSLSKYTDYKIKGCQDAGSQVHTYTIVDEYIKVAEDDGRRRILEQDEAAARALAEKARLDIPQGGWKDSDSEDSDEDRGTTDILDFRTDISKYKEDDEGNHRAMILDEASDDDVPMTEDDDEEFEIRQSLDLLYKNKKLMESKKPPRNYPDISFSLIAMERIICMDSQQLRQADMRGLIEPEPVKSSAGLTLSKSDDEDETKAGDAELDEDAMVSLLIQQHRMQEQLEQQGAIDEGMPTIILPDLTDVDKKEGEDEDDELLQEANAAEEAERNRQEQMKAEQEAAEKAAAAAAAAAQQAAEKDTDDKDEFDIAMDDLTIIAKADMVDALMEQHSVTVGPDHSEAGAALSVAGMGTIAEITSITDAPESGSKEDGTPPSLTESRGGAVVSPPEVKTIVPPSQSRPATGVASSTPSAMVGGSAATPDSSGMGGMSEIKCVWTELDEKFDEERILEEGAATEVPDVVDDSPLNLPQYNADEGLSDDEVTHWEVVKAQKNYATEMAELEDMDDTFGTLSLEDIKSGVSSALGQNDKDKKKLQEDDDYDDISSDETHHENSELSDHVELTEDASTDSEASEKLFTYKTGQRLSESGNKIYVDWGGTKDALDSEIAPIAPGPHLRQYWTFKCRETAGLEVTDITLHPLNDNIIAATYGSVHFGDHDKQGLVCIWNAKNNRSPERIYKLRAPGTCLAFSELTPFVLAVGMLDGNVVLFDVREDDAVILGATVDQKINYGHEGPVWQAYFLIAVDASNEDVVEESLLTLGDDGLLKKWTITKGLESAVLMKVGRSTLQVPGRREKRYESLITTLSIAYTVCFFPNNSDLFLLGTEEGFIHKCSTAYKESYVSTYVGHTGPVYRVAFSNFDDSVFYSCGGDWTVKMWKLEHPIPLLSLQTGHRTIFDVTCSMFSSTVFICATEYHIEVWDLSVNTLEPIVHYKPAFALGQRKVAFIGLLNSVIIGDDEGSLTIYGLRNFAKPPPTREAQRELLLESLLPGYKRKKEAEEAERGRRLELEYGGRGSQGH